MKEITINLLQNTYESCHFPYIPFFHKGAHFNIADKNGNESTGSISVSIKITNGDIGKAREKAQRQFLKKIAEIESNT